MQFTLLNWIIKTLTIYYARIWVRTHDPFWVTRRPLSSALDHSAILAVDQFSTKTKELLMGVFQFKMSKASIQTSSQVVSIRPSSQVFSQTSVFEYMPSGIRIGDKSCSFLKEHQNWIPTPFNNRKAP